MSLSADVGNDGHKEWVIHRVLLKFCSAIAASRCQQESELAILFALAHLQSNVLCSNWVFSVRILLVKLLCY